MPDKKLNLFQSSWQILKAAANGFIDDKITKLSGSLAYYMIFSMGPLLLIVITMSSIFFGKDAAQGKVYAQLEGFVGHDAAEQLQQIIKNASISGKNVLATIIGFGILLVGATSVFAEMQDSINMIWGLKAKPKRGWVKLIQNRFLSFSVIISLGFLLLVSLGFSAMVEGFGTHLKTMFPAVSVVFFYVLNQVITILVTTVIFGVIFKVLPDAKIRWKDVIAGALFTTFFFLLGKTGISFYISKSNVGSTYGTTGSLVVLLLWIYYSAMILYFGAEFTKAYSMQYGTAIHPAEYAVAVEQVEKEHEGISIQEKEKKKEENKS